MTKPTKLTVQVLNGFIAIKTPSNSRLCGYNHTVLDGTDVNLVSIHERLVERCERVEAKGYKALGRMLRDMVYYMQSM